MKAATKKNNRGMARFPAQLWDQMQFFFQEYNDHQLHAVIYFRGLIDRERIRKAVLLSMEAMPLLASRFVLDRKGPYWEKMESYRDVDVISFVDSVDPGEEIDRFVTNKTNELTGPQLMVRLVTANNKDALCIVMNHMVCDGAAFKEYLYLLASLYGEPESDGNILRYRNGSRDFRQIYRHMNLLDRVRAFFLPGGYRNHICFPLSGDQSGSVPFILKRILSQERFRALRSYAKKLGATVNDVVFAGYYRALHRTLSLGEGESITIPCMVDLRRYLPGGKADGLCNLTSSIACNIGADIGSNLGETVALVSAEMKRRKERYPGLAGLSTLHVLFGLLAFSKLRARMKTSFPNPLIGITNIGVIDSERLVFGDVPVNDAFVTGSIKYKPYFQLAFTTFNETITLTIAQYGSEKDRETIGRFLNALDKELTGAVLPG